ncbi:MAG: PH domain-containing protein, partial [Ktedonobacteraceae bacterium]|nr:PH domain-containing protein [Ktedonobacteraceae bacterium]
MADQKNKAPAASSKNSAAPWSLGHKRFSLQHFRLGRDKKWHFSGQQPGEDVRLVVRKHWWFLLGPALPFLGSLLLLFAVFWGWLAAPAIGQLWALLAIVSVTLTIGTGIWVAYRDVVVWWFETYIITNKRIISSRGLLEPTRQQIPLEKVTQIGVDMKSLWGIILGYGDVHVYLSGSQLVMHDVPSPKKVQEALQGVTDAVVAKKPKEEKPPKPKNTDLADVLDRLAKGKPVPELPDADEPFPVPPNQTYRGPRRTFGIFRFRCDVRYFSGEHTVRYVQRSQYVLLRNLLGPVLGLLVALPLATLPPITGLVPAPLLQIWFPFMGIVVLGLLVA